jgi:hypothetical protein
MTESCAYHERKIALRYWERDENASRISFYRFFFALGYPIFIPHRLDVRN